ncbi:MAG: clostripain-related cysteine peptidase [Clostridiales bacterium]|nr:clostripain-related cysteine peptidase [Clostridiales bacterium]
MKRFLKRAVSLLAVSAMMAGTAPVFAAKSSDAIKIGESPIPAAENIKVLPQSDWTVCVYMCGTDLESGSGAATSDLIEMLSADIPDNVTVLVMTGGTKTWNPHEADKKAVKEGLIKENAYITPDNEHTQIYRVDDDKMNLIYTYDSNLDMGDVCTVGEFMEFALTYAPSDHLMLEMWDHGGGPLGGFERDENTENMMSVTEYGELAKALYEARNKKTDIFGFDTCLTSNLETMTVLSKYGDYMVASEEVEPGTGWNYVWMSVFDEAYKKGQTAAAADVGRRIVDAFAKTYNQDDEWSDSTDLTLALTDLSRIPKLNEAFSKMSEELFAALDNKELYAKIARRAEEIQSVYNGIIGVMDLYDFANNMKDLLPSATEVLEVLGTPPGSTREYFVGEVQGKEPVVLYRGTGASLNRCVGMGFFYPTIASNTGSDTDSTVKMAEEYNDIAVSESYGKYIKDVLLKTDKLQTFTGKLRTGINTETSHFYMEITNPEDATALKSVDFICHYEKMNEDGTSTVYDLGNADVNADWDNVYFEETFDGKWYSIDGEFFTCNVTPQNGYSQYMIPVQVEGNDFISLMMLYAVDEEPENAYIAAIYDMDADGEVSRSYSADENLKFRTTIIEHRDDEVAGYKYACNDTVLSPISISTSEEDVDYALNIKKSELVNSKNVKYNMYFRATDMKNAEHLSEPCSVILSQDINDFTIKPIPDQIYTGKSVEPQVTVMWNDKELYGSADFAVSYRNNTEKGTATAVVTVDAEDLKGEITSSFEIKDVSDIFGDVSGKDWFFDNVAYMHCNGYMNGVEDNEFAPNTPLTRGMFAAMLYRFDGEPRFDGEVSFGDVDKEAYYAKAIGWAEEMGIVTGVGEDSFAPDKNITRADMAVMLRRYSGYKKLDTDISGDISQFNDNAQVPEYAQDGMSWAVGHSIMQGNDGKLLPLANATRAETAAMMSRFGELTN